MKDDDTGDVKFNDLFNRLTADDQRALIDHIKALIKRYQTRREKPDQSPPFRFDT